MKKGSKGNPKVIKAASLGGEARARILSSTDKKRIARNAAKARWG